LHEKYLVPLGLPRESIETCDDLLGFIASAYRKTEEIIISGWYGKSMEGKRQRPIESTLKEPNLTRYSPVRFLAVMQNGIPPKFACWATPIPATLWRHISVIFERGTRLALYLLMDIAEHGGNGAL
jgi:hypothetical protein